MELCSSLGCYRLPDLPDSWMEKWHAYGFFSVAKLARLKLRPLGPQILTQGPRNDIFFLEESRISALRSRVKA